MQAAAALGSAPVPAPWPHLCFKDVEEAAAWNGLPKFWGRSLSIALGAVVIVCSCNVLSDAKIRASIQDETGPRTPGAVYRCLGCSPNCGRCLATVQSLIAEALAETRATSDGGCGNSCGGMAALA